ncbi:MAG: DUF3887 domain-containing protein [Deltaproteobacteria bacterium]|nr:DUF3887 domain-containing protein [Deltaproteobacteria bacterium]
MIEKPRKRRRPFLRAMLLVGFLVILAGGIVVGLQLTRDRVDLRPQSEALLSQIADGKAAEVYAGGSPTFQELMLAERFVEIAETMNETLGPFVRTIDVLDSQLIDGASGRTARVVLRLKFKKATTTGQFSYQKLGGKWRLLGLSVKVPDNLRETYEAIEYDPARTRAPREVVTKARNIGRALEKGDLDAIYAVMSPPFRQSVSRSDLDQLIVARTRSLGKIERMLDVLSSTQNRKKDRAEVSAVLQFAEAKATMHLAFIKSERGDWLLSRMQIPYPGAGP